ncbi:hypothetical protein D0N36_08470 [Hymenobacter lapidiphilus]|nr:hypothetical protein D0N36_08470 [Hymenobacter sp. CCM 8763]
MVRSTLLTALLTCTLLAGCQSARFSPALPRVSEYGAVRPQPTDGSQRPAMSADEPVLLAALPGPDPVDGARQEARMFSSVVSKSLRVQATPLLATPDTAVNRMLEPQPKPPVDPSTTAVNIVGGATVAVGLGAMVASVLDDRSTASSLAPALGVLTGLGLLVVGVALMFFQGKNGRMRKLREAREAAVIPTAATIRSRNFKTGLRKVGRGLLIAAGVLLLLGILVPYGIYFVVLPVLVLGVIGLLMVAFSN